MLTFLIRKVLHLKVVSLVFIILISVSLLTKKYFVKHIPRDILVVLKKVNIALIVLCIIAFVAVVFFDFSFEQNQYGWHVNFIDYKSLHKYSKGKSQKIALIDSGVSSFQIGANDKNVATLVGDVYDKNGHGTMMYSIIKGYDKQIYGLAPDANILSIKIMDSDEKLPPALIRDAIKVAIEQKSTIINLSIGSYIYDKEISDLIDLATKKGVTFVASSGDYGSKDIMFPADKSNVISVGSLSANNQISHFTNAPSDCTIIAPGDEIKTIDTNKVVANTSGTSQSTAIISGYIALLKDYAIQKNKVLTNDVIKDKLVSINSKKQNYVDALLEIG